MSGGATGCLPRISPSATARSDTVTCRDGASSTWKAACMTPTKVAVAGLFLCFLAARQRVSFLLVLDFTPSLPRRRMGRPPSMPPSRRGRFVPEVGPSSPASRESPRSSSVGRQHGRSGRPAVPARRSAPRGMPRSPLSRLRTDVRPDAICALPAAGCAASGRIHALAGGPRARGIERGSAECRPPLASTPCWG